MKKVLIIGPAHPLRGGLASFNHRLCLAFQEAGYDCEIISFSLQYPGFLFPGKTQYSDAPTPDGVRIHRLINSINPLNWLAVGRKIGRMKPHLVIVRYWLPFMAPSLGTVIRVVKRYSKEARVVCLADNIVPHEKRPGDKTLTRYFLSACDAVLTMSDQVTKDLQQVAPGKPAICTPHPLFDNFGDAVPRKEARRKLAIAQEEKLLLFFGFIRKYKGLDLLLHAMASDSLKKAGVKLLVAGEFYEDEKYYRDLVTSLGIENTVIMKTDFIPEDEVRYYFGAADVVVQPYRSATQSGVTPLAYHFEKPMIVTNVGGLPEMVPPSVGVVTEPRAEAIAQAVADFFSGHVNRYGEGIRVEKQKFSWSRFVGAVLQLAQISEKKRET